MNNKTMIVQVVDRSTWGAPGPYPRIRSVEIGTNCPKCGGPRGEPYWYAFREDGGSYRCHKWDNPCGHIDMHEDCLKEARERKIIAHMEERPC